jgi:predicted transposase YbfD/YdcC
VLGQARVADKSTEIVAIPQLLDLLQIEGAIVTIDAMGCQRDSARKIVDKKADYILALKGSLRADAELFADEQIARGCADTAVTRTQTIDGEHGRIETRTVTVMHDIDWLRQRHDWPGLTALARVESVREIAGKAERERRFYITSSAPTAEHLAPAIRAHWSIENSLHWVMDMIFRDDDSRGRTGNAPANLAAIRHMAQNLIRARKGKLSVKANLKAAAWNDNHLIRLLMA